MAKRDPRTGELLTTNYSWTKPTVGSSVDAWGGYVNADLDAIDSVVHGIQTSIPSPSFTQPLMNGTAAAGTAPTWARADHVHPTDARIIGESRIINGDMGRDQRNNGASGTAIGYTVDRWTYFGTQASKVTWQQGALGPSGFAATGFPYAFSFTSSSAYASVAADQFNFNQAIEADMVSDLVWGTANAQPITLSFWVISSLTGTFSGAIYSYPTPSTRSYPFTFSLPAANTWTKVTITIPGDTAGAWVMSGNAAAVGVTFDLGCGVNFRGPAGAWASANYRGVTGSVSIVAANGATFWVTGVKLEIGSVATPFQRQSSAKTLADCQRYFEMSYDIGTVPGAIIANGATLWRCITADPFTTGTSFFKVAKRATPTVTIYSPNTGASGKIYAVNPSTDQPAYLPNGAGTTAFAAGINNSSVSSTSVTHHWTASAEL